MKMRLDAMAETSKGSRRQRGVVAIEFAIVFMLGLLPLLVLTLTGVLIFAAQQSLTLAASEGARAALRYGTAAQRQTAACQAAQQSMQWLLNYSGDTLNCAAPTSPGGTYTPIAVSAAAPCSSSATTQCMTVVTSFNYDQHPFFPGTKTLYGWAMNSTMSSTATVQLDMSGN